MKKRYLPILLIFLSYGPAQTLCPPAFLMADPGNTEADLSWTPPDTAYYGDILVAECFEDCDSAGFSLNIEHVVDNNSGGWFRYAGGDPIDCGNGMLACGDGGTDDFSAIGYYPDAGVSVDSRMMTDELDLTSYTTATIEFVEGYGWWSYANDSNLVEVSTDSGVTWNSVYVSNAEDVQLDIVARTIDISSYAGNMVMVGFRYMDSLGDGENWYVDNIRIWGGTDGRSYSQVIGQTVQLGKRGEQNKRRSVFFDAPERIWANESIDRDSPCGTFQSYNIYQDGTLIENVSTNSHTVTGLTNFQEYCFTVTAVYAEGESDTCFNACTSPSDPFIVTPVEISAIVGGGELLTETVSVTNNTDEAIDYSIFSMEVANLEVATELMIENFDLGLWGNMYDSDAIWQISDSAGASSVYLTYPGQDDGLFAYYNDDVMGADSIPRDTYLASNIIVISGDETAYLMMDMFYPQLGGPCGTTDIDDGFYVDHSSIWVSTDGANTWSMIDSSYANGDAGWQKLLYNITPYTSGNSILQVAIRYSDCGGHWGYGIGVDNVAVKQGDDYSWLTLSPVESTIGSGATVNVTVGIYGFMVGMTASETAVMTATPYEVDINVSMAVGESSIDTPEGVPGEFALHQNHPNPFNPVTHIRFDIPETSYARMDIYNVTGQHVRTLFNQAVEPGYHLVQWDGKSKTGTSLPSGMYMYRLHAGNYRAVEKLLLLK